MYFKTPVAKSELEKIFLDQIEHGTPRKIKEKPLIDLNNKEPFEFVLTREHLADFNEDEQSNGLGVEKWLANYEKEAKASTGGIRGVQNPLYPWDTRYPLNLLGVMLATLGKALVAKEKTSTAKKIAACEVRYNSPQYVELIARIQATYGIETQVTDNYETIPIWMASFLIFMLDLYGGEYVTSSHAISKKIATKDLNNQGSQYTPTESSEFVDKIKSVIEEVKSTGQYKIKLSAANNTLIDKQTLKKLENGVSLYANYLRSGVANQINLSYINGVDPKIIVECVGGCMYKTLNSLFSNLGILDNFFFTRKEENPFFHGIGKNLLESRIFDWGCDSTILDIDFEKNLVRTPVIETMDYREVLKDYPLGTTILMTDPDGDRLVTAYIESTANKATIEQLGLVSFTLDEHRIFVMLTPNQSFLMTFDFQKRALEKSSLWDKYDWFLLKTTASQLSWDEWAQSNDVKVLNTPVGFKELAEIIQKIEHKIESHPNQDVVIEDVLGKKINLGKKPRLFFAGEESGGEILGTPDFIVSEGGRKALSMREKSAGEAMIITSAMVGWMQGEKRTPTQYLAEIFESNKIKSRYEIRIDHKYYNESEPDINLMIKAKEAGMDIRTHNDKFFLSIALAYKDKIISLDQVKRILSEGFPALDFTDLLDIKFVGDGTYLLFANKCLEVRPSGTDAINKAYSYGNDKQECVLYAQKFTSYNGDRTPLHRSLIPEYFYNNVKNYSYGLYTEYRNKNC